MRRPFFEAVPYFESVDFFSEPRGEFIVDGIVHVDSGLEERIVQSSELLWQRKSARDLPVCADTSLTRLSELARYSSLYSCIDIGIFED